MNKDSFVLLASLFVVMIENIDALQAAGWRWDVGEGLSPVDKVFRDMASPGGFGQPASMTQYRLFPNTEGAEWVRVHINGVIHNRAAYLKLTTKDAAAWPTMSPREVAAIFYLAMTQAALKADQH